MPAVSLARFVLSLYATRAVVAGSLGNTKTCEYIAVQIVLLLKCNMSFECPPLTILGLNNPIAKALFILLAV
jgi:hypothetical protein